MRKPKMWLSLLLIGIFMSSISCRQRTDLDVAAGIKTPAQLEQDLDALRREREKLLADLQDQQLEAATKVSDLTTERDELMSSKSSIEAEIQKARDELLQKQNATEAEKNQIKAKLEGAEKNLSGVQERLRGNEGRLNEQLNRIRTLNAEMKKLTDKISELTARIDELTQALNAERLKNERLSQGNGDIVAASLPTVLSTDKAPMEVPPTGTGSSSSKETTDSKPWQFFTSLNGASVCFEFGSTSVNASLMALACVNPAPSRQQFKIETAGQGFLLVDQRSSMCARIDPKGTSKVSLQACTRDGSADELWEFTSLDGSQNSFKFRNVKAGLCLSVSPEKRIVQQDCSSAMSFQSR